MSTDKNINPTRRDVLKVAGGLAATAALPGFALPSVHMGNDETIQVALVGAGGRGGGAAANALSTKNGPVKLVAIADVFQDRLDSTYNNLAKSFKDTATIPKERQFVGFDAYKKAMDVLKPGDVVILTTPPAFRWVHFQYAISKKLNVFMEKPVTVDGPSSKRMLALNEQAKAAGLKVGVGLMSRHARWLQELKKRIEGGELGEIILTRGYRMHGPAATFESTPKPDGISDLEYQIRRFHSFLWCSGGCFNDFYIHIIDQGNWMKNALPVSAQAIGGRHYKQNKEGQVFVDQNLDTYGVEYTYPDGTKMFFDGRCIDGTYGRFSSYVHGTKGVAIASRANDCGGPSAIYKGHNMDQENLLWQSTDRSNPYQNEWDALMESIRANRPHNEVQHGVEASMTCNLGRMAAHTGQLVTWDQAIESTHEFAPNVDKLDYNTPSPLMPETTGRYPIPQPGIKTDREY